MKAHTLNEIRQYRPYVPLMLAVMVSAAIDAHSDDLIRALDGRLFLEGEDYSLWMEALGRPDVPVEFWLYMPIEKLYSIKRMMS